MKRIELVLALTAVIVLNSCAASKAEPLYFNDGVANLSGMWVLSDSNKSEMDVMLDVAFNGNLLDLKVWGESVVSQKFVRSKNQFLISYTTEDGQKFNILAQLEKNNLMRLSRTTEAVLGFVPIGQLGEKVYRLTKLKENRTFVTKTIDKR